MTIDQVLQIALLIASMGLAGFCIVLSRRLRRLNDLESGLGGAIAVMAAEVDRLEGAIRAARAEATAASQGLAEEIKTARHERALWDLRQKIAVAASEAALPPAAPAENAAAPRRRRKRTEEADA